MVGLLYDAGTFTQQEAPCFARRTNETRSAAGMSRGDDPAKAQCVAHDQRVTET